MKMSAFIAFFIFFSSFTIQVNNSEKELFVVITSADSETQMMAMVLATQSVNQDVKVRILLCGEAGNLAITGYNSPAFAPSGRAPGQLLAGLLERGITVEVCGIFLPNRDFTDSDLISGVSIASPPEIAAYMMQEHVRYFTF